MFGVVLRVIRSKLEAKLVLVVFGEKPWNYQSWFQSFLAKNHELPPWDLGQNFKLAKTFSIGKRSREMMFRVVLRMIRSKLESKVGFSRSWIKTMN